MTTAIEVKNIYKTFNDKEVLHDITFNVKRGEIFGLLGPSGAGKTTLLKIINGQLKANKGISKVLGKLSSELDNYTYSKMGLVLDDSGLYLRLTCYQNLKIMAILYGLSNDEIINILKKVELYDAKDKVVEKLSKGMYQRMVFARALIHKPELLFLDEPTTGLDPVTTCYLHDMIIDLSKNGTTIIMTTHNMDEATKLCNNVGLLHEGRIIEYGSPNEICNRYKKELIYSVVLSDNTTLQLINNEKNRQKIVNYFLKNQIQRIHSLDTTLLSIFVNLTGKELE